MKPDLIKKELIKWGDYFRKKLYFYQRIKKSHRFIVIPGKQFTFLIKTFTGNLYGLLSGAGEKFLGSKGLGIKIGMGFFVLICFSMVIAVTGLVGMNKLNKVFNDNQATVDFVDKVYQVGAAVKDYQRSGASEDIKKVNDLVGEMDTVRKNNLSPEKEGDGKNTEEIWNFLTQYQNNINKYALLKDDQDKFYGTYLNCESQAYRLVEEILLFDMARGYQLKTKLAEIGVEVRGFVVDGAEEAKREAYSAGAGQKVREAESLVKSLSDSGQDPAMAALAARLQAQIKSMESSFGGIEQADQAKAQKMAEVVESGEKVLQAAKGSMASGVDDIGRSRIFAYVLLLFTTGACFVSGILLSVMITRGITRPILGTVKFAREISLGNLSIPDLKMKSRDEVSVLGETLNEMKNSLHSMVLKIQRSTSDLAAASQQMLVSAKQIAEAAQSQSDHLHKITIEVKQLAEAAQRVSHYAQNTLATVQEAKEKGQSGEKTVSQAVYGMELINENVEMLNKSSLRIGEILRLISKISDQTKLLSFNASIEAARAGEAGRSFSVVAREIKKLADTSQKENKEIESIVLAIQKGNSTTEKAAKEGSVLSENSGRAFQDIAYLVNCVADKVNEITGEAQSQEAGSNKVVSVIEEVSLNVEQTAAGAEEMLATAEELEAMAEQLRTMTMAFQVG